MNWSNVSAVADVLTAVVVIISLIYLGTQIKDARNSFVGGTQHQLGENFSDFMRSIWSDAEIFALWTAMIHRPDSLDEDQRQRLGMILFSMFALFSSIVELAEFDRRFLLRYAAAMDRMLSIDYIQGWWTRQGHSYPAGSRFREYIDERIGAIVAGRIAVSAE